MNETKPFNTRIIEVSNGYLVLDENAYQCGRCPDNATKVFETLDALTSWMNSTWTKTPGR